MLAFADEGDGIPEEIHRKIFDPYFTTKTGGTFLGLTSTYAIIKSHDGQILVSSAPGAGTTFTLYLPAYGDISEPVSSETRPVAPRTGKGTILVMDDEQMIRALVTHTLQQCGYTVMACADGAEAVARYAAAQHEGNPYAAVLLDLTVPGGMGGAVAARQILDAMPEAKLIVFSGYSDDPVMADFRSYGFCAALTKLFRAGELAEVVTQVVADVSDP